MKLARARVWARVGGGARPCRQEGTEGGIVNKSSCKKAHFYRGAKGVGRRRRGAAMIIFNMSGNGYNKYEMIMINVDTEGCQEICG